MTDIEQSLLDAFRLAENSWRAAGRKPRSLKDMVHKRRDGSRWTGPSKYKVTLFLYPWEYADAVMAMMVSPRPDRSLHRYLVDKLFVEGGVIPEVAARPVVKRRPPPDNVIPIARKKRPAVAAKPKRSDRAHAHA